MGRSQTTYVVLGILAIHPSQSGYEIRKTIQQTVGFFWGESFGQIYPTLKRLAAEGLIEPCPVAAGARPKRQEYSITPAGQACLQEWLAIPYREDPPRDEFLLKIFFGKDAAPGANAAQIRRFQEKNQRLLATLLELETLARAYSGRQPGFQFWMLTHSYGVGQLRAALEWSEKALKMLSESGADAPQNPLDAGSLSGSAQA
jgi:DNA-binding PadR family transcriptional regulator